MTQNDLHIFEREFNESKRTIEDLFKIAKNHGISVDDFGDPDENDSEYIWTLTQFGQIHQCKNCKALEFVELVKKQNIVVTENN